VALTLTETVQRASVRLPRSWPAYFLLLGLYLSLRGYHSFDGDQTYRLPLLLHRQDPSLYADDPFVRGVDEFNPHRGSIALLDLVSRPLGLPAGLFALFALTFFGTCWGVARLARQTWPERGPAVGWIAVGLVLMAKAGNIGTNHLFEAMLLDRLMALALGWIAIAEAVTRPASGWWRASISIGLATLIHPSVGLQLAMLLASSWYAWAIFARFSLVRPAVALRGLASLALVVLPGLLVNLPRSADLVGTVPDSLFWLLSVELQNPQHMLPHLWRFPQWLSWGAYLALAALHLAQMEWRSAHDLDTGATSGIPDLSTRAPRRRLAIMLALILLGLAMAWYAIEILHNIRITIFQPFRMGTLARGISLVLISDRLLALWISGSPLNRVRAAVLATSVLGDWRFVVAASAEVAVSTLETIRGRFPRSAIPKAVLVLVYGLVLIRGLDFLAHHDTESGHLSLMVAVGVGLLSSGGGWVGAIAARILQARQRSRSRTWAVSLTAAWLVPGAALLAALIPPRCTAARSAIVRSLVDRCRFYPMPLDDIERLALWCRDHTPASSRFIGPPGPKTFRLWSRRSLAFSRAGSPYHGAGLADWFARFQDHVDDHRSPQEFVRAYREHRHEIESRYDAMSDGRLAALALRQGADYIIAEAPKARHVRPDGEASGPLQFLHAEGRYAVYRLDSSSLVQRQQ
jgi:hypothetical protein